MRERRPPGRSLTLVPEPARDVPSDVERRSSTATRTLRCRTVAKGRLRQVNYIRDLAPQPVIETEPDSLLNEEEAPNPSEALLAAFGSCLAIGIHARALMQRIPIRALELDLDADVKTLATAVTADGDAEPLGFEVVRVSVNIQADAPDEVLDALVKHATLWSPVANTLHNPVHLDVVLRASTAS